MKYFNTKYLTLRIPPFSRLTPYLFFVLASVGMIFLLNSDFTKVANISCKTQYGPCGQNQEEKLQAIKGLPIFLFDTKKVSQVFSSDFRVKEVFAHKIFPNKLSVFLELRKPLVALKLFDLPEKGFFLIDQDGFILEFTQDSPLPQLQAKKNNLPTQVGQKVGQPVVFGARLIYSIYKLNLGEVNILGILEKDRVLTTLGQTRVFFPSEGDDQALVGALQLILTRSRMDARLPKSIDLRYSNPVVIY